MGLVITTIVIVVIAAIATWFKKLGQPKDTDEETRMRRSVYHAAAKPARSATSRFDAAPAIRPRELGRGTAPFVGGRNAWSASAHAPAPGRHHQAPRPITPPPLPRPTFAPQPPRPVRSSSARRRFRLHSNPGAATATFQESSQAYERASSLGSTVSQHIDSVPDRRCNDHRGSQPDIARTLQAVSLFQNARPPGQAIIASIIPPAQGAGTTRGGFLKSSNICHGLLLVV